LTEDSVHEIPVAKALVALSEKRKSMSPAALPFDPFSFSRRASQKIIPAGIPTGGDQIVRVAVLRETYDKLAHKLSALGDFQPEIICEEAGILEVDPRDDAGVAAVNARPEPGLVTIPDSCDLDVIPAFRMLAARLDPRHPILLKDTFQNRGNDFSTNLLSAATNLGSLLCDGIGDAVLVQGEESPGQSLRIAYNILQASGVRIFKTDYVACPSCGRTLFNLQETTARIKEATLHLKGVKIAIMGCIVNGPGEMADADFGYVGGAPGKVNLYVGKTPVKFNIPESEAVERLVDLIREHGRWFDAPAALAS
ncbi:MAG: flavodoxin-dependent (E)-4-hydroxy-3-methylbut-2-enyl-diphosphate synthase, partial [Terrimicrobiaceae bacterium]